MRSIALLVIGTVAIGGAMSAVALAAAPPAPAAAPAKAAKPATPGAPGADANLPYDIVADNNQDFQAERRAVWWGNVEAIQGTSRLRTPRLTAYFSPKDPNAPKAAAGAGPGADVGHVERIEAEGPVYYTTPTQRAKGDHATFLAADNTITLTGNVVATQDKNVSTGDKLVIDKANNKATWFSAPATSGAPHQRVRAVLYPNQNATGPANGTGPAGAAKAPGKP